MAAHGKRYRQARGAIDPSFSRRGKMPPASTIFRSCGGMVRPGSDWPRSVFVTAWGEER